MSHNKLRIVVAVTSRLVLLAICFAQPGLSATGSDGVVTELFFSEIVEGSSFNKAIEIYNGTEDVVELQNYDLEVYFNGNPTPELTIDLEGALSPGAVHVVAHARATGWAHSSADQLGEFGWFNGNDAIVLTRSGVPVDVFGRLVEDPGSHWGSGSTSTANNTLRRTESTCAGDANGDDRFEPAAEWRGFGTDAFGDLGAHSAGCKAGEYESRSSEERPSPDLTRIFEVQGAGEASPVEDETVTVRGVVVGDFQERDELSGFFLQDVTGDGRPETSDGVFVYLRSRQVEVGDVVEVTGEVEEYHDLTEITDVTRARVVGRANLPDPAAVVLPLPERTGWERYEGMLLTIASRDSTLDVSEVYHLGRGGVVMLADEPLVQFTQQHEPSAGGYLEHLESIARGSIILDDGSLLQNPDPIPYAAEGDELTAHQTVRVGDTAGTVTGVLSYGYSGWSGTDAFRIHPTREVDFTATNPRPALPPQVGGTIQVVSFNVLNFFNGEGRGGGFPTSRGAESAGEMHRQLDKLVAAIVPLDAEVLAFVEIENDGGEHSALAQLVGALNEGAGERMYDYIETGPLGGDEIRVALAYQFDQVRPVAGHRVLNSTHEDGVYTFDPRFNDTRNRPALAQTFEELDGGARFTVIVNHLKSKGSPCPGDARRPPDGQGNCNDVRLEAAAALADWARVLALEAGDPDVLITGDLNSYAMEDPIRLLRGDGLVNLLGEDASTYVFAGESGTLDYALATPSLAGQVTGADTWHINAQEPSVLDYNTNFKSQRQVELLYSRSPFRSSDHDPVVVALDLQPQE